MFLFILEICIFAQLIYEMTLKSNNEKRIKDNYAT